MNIYMIYQNLAEFITSLPSNGRLIGLDIGTKKIGIALTDALKIISSPLEIVSRINLKKDVNKIISIITKHEVVGVVAGYPLRLDGREGDMCPMVNQFISKLSKESSLPIFMQDERMSTQSAERIMNEYSLSWLKKSQIEDKIAASFILQATIDQIANFTSNIQ
jgi:putative Holliday junction resolvase